MARHRMPSLRHLWGGRKRCSEEAEEGGVMIRVTRADGDCCGRPVGFPHDFRCWHSHPAPMVAAAMGYVDELIFGLMQWRSAEPELFAPLAVPMQAAAS